MKEQIFNTRKDWTGFVIRLTLAIVIFPHGAQKMLGWFGGPGFNKELELLTTQVQLPWIVSLLVIVIEFFGALALLAGWASRLWSVIFVILFIGIIFTAHTANGFFMNWFGNQPGEGYEYHLLVIGLAIALFINGSGNLSVDAAMSQSMQATLSR